MESRRDGVCPIHGSPTRRRRGIAGAGQVCSPSTVLVPIPKDLRLDLRCATILQRVQLFARLEADGLAGCDADLRPGAGIAANAGLARADAEDAKAAQFD